MLPSTVYPKSISGVFITFNVTIWEKKTKQNFSNFLSEEKELDPQPQKREKITNKLYFIFYGKEYNLNYWN